jgi:hypothetical protein
MTIFKTGQKAVSFMLFMVHNKKKTQQRGQKKGSEEKERIGLDF